MSLIKKSILPLLFITLVSFSANANPVDMRTAREVATKFVNANTRVPLRGAEDLQLVTTYSISHGDAAFHIFNTPNGFVIVAADDCATPILGYSDEGRPFDMDNVPIQLNDVLQEYVEQIGYGIEHHLVADEKTAEQWRQVRATGKLSSNRDITQVGPLLSTTWGQSEYYNTLCPEDAAAPNGHVVTGCIATAMAQIIKYWGYPAQGKGTHSYESNYGMLTVNYAESNYDFENMPVELTAESTPEEVSAVSKLMYECGVAANTSYDIYSSGSTIAYARAALINHYCYSSTVSYVKKTYLTETNWNYLLQENISSNRPVLCSGGPHAFVCDGFDQNNFYHFNYGWYGDADGWFLFNVINPYGNDFNSNLSVLVNIYPEANMNAAIGHLGNSQYEISGPLDFYNNSGTDPFTSLMYNGVVSETIVFIPDDSTQQLVVDVMKFNKHTDNEIIDIYDGLTTDYYIRSIYYGDPNSINDTPIVSTRNAITIVIYDANLDQNGCHLRISKDCSCRMVSNIVASINDETINLSWDENGTSSSWKIEYGEEGFVTGEGTSLLSITNNISILVDDPYATIDVRIQPVCDTLDNNLIKSILLNKKHYWTDVVNSQPEGYYMDSDGTIHVSSAEGLAWVAKLRNQSSDGYSLSFHDISVEEDIDLSGYHWSPIFSWNGNFYGNGHVLSNMKVVEGYYSGGLFVSFVGDTIIDVGFNNSYIEGWGASTIGNIGDIYNPTVIINCYSNNYTISAKGTGSAVGLCDGAEGTEMINCFSRGKLLDGFAVGGLGGGNITRNCYSSVELIDNIGWRGLISGNCSGRSYYNCFADIDYVEDTWSAQWIGAFYDADHTELGYFFGEVQNPGITWNVAGFKRRDNSLAHTVPDTALNYQYSGSVDLVSVLNQGVIEMNSPLIRTWEWDNTTGLPVFGDFYEVTCPNVSDITAANIPYGDGFAVALSWHENGLAEEWQIKCQPYGVTEEDSTKYYSTCDNVYYITDLTLGQRYDIYVRPICDANSPIVWGKPLSFLVDKTYWVDIVTSCPDGYVEDDDGNVTISSPEGLAWLSVCSNGLNGQTVHNYNGKIVSIVTDIDMGTYKWTPISQFLNNGQNIQFMGDFNGNGHVIRHLYCNEKDKDYFYKSYIGFIGLATKAKIYDVKIADGSFWGMDRIGALLGVSYGSEIDNCHTINVDVTGITNIGGLVGSMETPPTGESCILTNSSSSGIVFGDQSTGGLVGFGKGVFNCYSTANVSEAGEMISEYKGGFIGGASGSINNCYSVGDVEYGLNPWGSTIGRSMGQIYPECIVKNIYAIAQVNTPFFGNASWGEPTISDTASFGVSGVFQSSVFIGETPYTVLLDALNAWVDANNTEGQYLHWVADTTMVNGGFPIHEEPMSPTVQLQSLPSGWTWYAPTVQTSVESIQSSLGNNLELIQAKDGVPSGNVVVGEMYKIQTIAPCTLAVTGVPITSATITINSGENWIGFVGTEKTVAAAFANFTPVEGDKVISQDEGFAIFENGEWRGTLGTLEPGKGYVYVSNAAEPKTLVIGE
ncbi:MAG: C10 family peptidase [Bacteroidales bacterium]|nr:C10 family peptidase [Bacteroidales bacterium]MBR6227616.1 C10 family peptidase [Bacteroidales bacterium]